MNVYYRNEWGELWHGDCLEVMELLAAISEPVDMILCDLPYGTTACNWDTVIPFDLLWESYKKLCDGAIVLTASQPFTSSLVMSNLSMFKYEWIWEKNRGSNFAATKFMPMKEHENICVFGIGKLRYNPQMEMRAEGGKSRAAYPIKPSNTGKREVYLGLEVSEKVTIDPHLRVPRSIQKFNTEVGLHPTQKPVALFEYLIKTYTTRGDLVLDNCAGSGTTAVAAQNTGRRWICIEKEEKYCEIIANRLEGGQR